MGANDRRIRLHVQNPPSPETAPPGYPVRKMDPAFFLTRDQYEDACRRHPDVAARIDVGFGDTPADFEAGMADAEAVIATTQVLKERFPAAAPGVRWVMVTSSSYHKLLPVDWLPPGAVLVHNPGAHAPKAGEFMATALLMLNGRIPYFVSAKEERRWAPLITSGIAGKTVAVVGVGHLGGEGARRARDLGLSVLGVRRSGAPHPHCDAVVGPDRLAEILPRADFVIHAVPYTAETHGMLDAGAFAAMKPGAGFVTTAPTRTFDYEALAAGLVSGHLSGAVLDGFDPEPVPSDSALWTTPNLIMTPHTACIDAAAVGSRTFDVLFRNLRADLDGEPLPTLADVERGY